MFNGCKFLTYKGLTQRNSPSNHISITSSTAVTLSNIHLIAPANSPNTDGIDISSSNHIHILGSSIETGINIFSWLNNNLKKIHFFVR